MDWLALMDGSQLPQIWHGLVQVPTPTPSPSAAAQVDVLRQHLEFLTKANELLTKANERQSAEFLEKMKLLADEHQKLSESFKTFVSAMKDGVYFVGILSGLGIGLLTFLFGRSLKEVEETAKSAVTRQVEERMAAIADNRIDLVRRSLEREGVVDQAKVEYWLLGGQPRPREFQLLETRGFQQVQFCNQEGQRSRRRDVDVVVLDLNNWCDAQGKAFGALTKADQEAKVKEQLDLITSGVAGRSMVFVVFVAGRYDCLDEVGKTYWVTPTNNSVTLVGTVVDAAYIAAGMQ
jgi:hypothetical protein